MSFNSGVLFANTSQKCYFDLMEHNCIFSLMYFSISLALWPIVLLHDKGLATSLKKQTNKLSKNYLTHFVNKHSTHYKRHYFNIGSEAKISVQQL